MKKKATPRRLAGYGTACQKSLAEFGGVSRTPPPGRVWPKSFNPARRSPPAHGRDHGSSSRRRCLPYLSAR